MGIGDINGSFLPQTNANPTSGSSPSLPSLSESPATDSPSSADSPLTLATPPDSSSLIIQAKLLDEVSEARPLAKLQRALEQETTEEESVVAVTAEVGVEQENGATPDGETRSTTPPGSPTKARKPLLNAYDEELDRLSGVS